MVTGAQGNVAFRLLKLPQGVLGGIGRRMSFLWGGNVTSGTEAVSFLTFKVIFI